MTEEQLACWDEDPEGEVKLKTMIRMKARGKERNFDSFVGGVIERDRQWVFKGAAVEMDNCVTGR